MIMNLFDDEMKGPTAVALRTHQAYGKQRYERYKFDAQCVENEEDGLEAAFSYWVKCGLTTQQYAARHGMRYAYVDAKFNQRCVSLLPVDWLFCGAVTLVIAPLHNLRPQEILL